MGKKKAEIAYDDEVSEEQRVQQERENYTLDFVEAVHKEVTGTLLEDPEEFNKLFQKLSRVLSKKYRILLNKGDINKEYQKLVKSKKLAPSYIIDSVTKNKSVRSRSGVLPISVATDGNNFSCAYDCHFCPNETVKLGAPRDMARSYLSSEGTFLRGAVENFEPAGQVWRRLLELELMGHPPDKCEMIVLGGTWDSYPEEYRQYFIHQIFYACNVFHRFSLRVNGDLSHLTRDWAALNPFQNGMSFDPDGVIKAQLRPPKTLAEEKLENQEAVCSRIIGILLETRPDQINKANLVRLRSFGCTRIQLGLQHTDNAILKLNNRGHKVEQSVRAIKFAVDNCFKVDGHLMPDLPGTDMDKDLEMIDRVFGGDDLQLDYCKLYPCLDLPYTKTREWKRDGSWKPMAEHAFPEFLDVLRHALARVPPWVRVNRVQRDFPEASAKNLGLGFVSDHIKSNLQQMVHQHLEKHGQACYDVRCREIKNAAPQDAEKRAVFMVRTYRAHEGTEFFLTVEIPARKPRGPDDNVLMGLCRVRVTDHDAARVQASRDASTSGAPPAPAPPAPSHFLPEFAAEPMARVRELHVYGNLRMVQNVRSAGEGTNSQHGGVGKFLMAAAERLAHAYGFRRMAVISGVGVREYYAKLGYSLHEGSGEFMMKTLGDEAALLPLKLFGLPHNPDIILLPTTRLQIPSQYLPPPRWKKGRMPADGEWYSEHSYPHIQNGAAGCVTVKLHRARLIDATTSSGVPWIAYVIAYLLAAVAFGIGIFTHYYPGVIAGVPPGVEKVMIRF